MSAKSSAVVFLLFGCAPDSSVAENESGDAPTSTDESTDSEESSDGELDQDCEPAPSAFSFSSSALEGLPNDVVSLSCTVSTLESSGEAWMLSFACPALDAGVFDLQFQASPAFDVLPFAVGEPLTLELSSEAECLECHRYAIAIYSSEAQLQMLLFDSTDQLLSTVSGFIVEPDTPTLRVEQFSACEDDGQPPSERQYSLRFSRGEDELLLPPAQRSGELVSGERFDIRVGESTRNPAPVGTTWRYFGVVVSR